MDTGQLDDNKPPLTGTTMKKYKKQMDWRLNKVRELLTKGYSQKGISSTLYISPPTVSRDMSFVKNNYNIEFDTNNTKTKFAEDYCMAQMSFDEVKKKF